MTMQDPDASPGPSPTGPDTFVIDNLQLMNKQLGDIYQTLVRVAGAIEAA